MVPFRIHVLGCGSAKPSLRHFASSQLVEIRGKLMMIDCAEGTQIQLYKTHISFTKISCVFISHLHGDHCLGLVGMISTFGMLGRTAPLHVYGPEPLGSLLKMQLEVFCPGLDYEVKYHPVDTTLHQIVYEDRSIIVKSIPLNHRVPCCGYLFAEKPTLPHIRRDMLDCYEIPYSQINNIKSGADWVTPDGEVIGNSKLVLPADPARSYAYCSDTAYLPRLHEMIQGVNLLYHESTYTSDKENKAIQYYHSTARQAAMVAQAAHAGQLMLGHYSARYDDETVLLDEAKEVFPNVILADEGLVVDVC